MKNFILILFLAGIVGSCSSVAVTDTGDAKSQLSQLSGEISAMTKNRACTQDSECQTVGIGVKPCGGPKKYVVYSTKVVNGTELLVKANSYNGFDRQINNDSGLVGTCNVLVPPKTKCLKLKCVQLLNPAGTAGPQ